MAKAILDTNFILSCIDKKIDFFEAISFIGFNIIIPNEVIGELKKFSSNGKTKLAQNSDLALKILGKNDFEEIYLKEKNVDKGIVKFAKENPEIAITIEPEEKTDVSINYEYLWSKNPSMLPRLDSDQ